MGANIEENRRRHEAWKARNSAPAIKVGDWVKHWYQRGALGVVTERLPGDVVRLETGQGTFYFECDELVVVPATSWDHPHFFLTPPSRKSQSVTNRL